MRGAMELKLRAHTRENIKEKHFTRILSCVFCIHFICCAMLSSVHLSGKFCVCNFCYCCRCCRCRLVAVFNNKIRTFPFQMERVSM